MLAGTPAVDPLRVINDHQRQGILTDSLAELMDLRRLSFNTPACKLSLDELCRLARKGRRNHALRWHIQPVVVMTSVGRGT